MELGVRAHDLGTGTVEVLGKRINEKGFTSVQLALEKAIYGLENSTGKLSPGLGEHVKEVLYKNNIKIAIMGCYINLIHPEEGERKKSINKFKEYIRYARDFGCSIIGSETGSYNADCSYHEDNSSEEAFLLCAKTIKELAKEAEKFGVIVGIEAVTCHVVNSPERMFRMLQYVDSNNVQVIFDPVNLLNIHNYKMQDEIIKKSLELFGDRIVIVHAKDYIVKDGEMIRVAAGKGLFNYELLLRYLSKNKPFVNIILEEIEEKDMKDSLEILTKIYANI